MPSITPMPLPGRDELRASAQGLLAQNFDRQVVSATQIMTGGRAYAMLVGLRAGDTIGNVYVACTTAGSSMTLFKAGIYSVDGATKYAATADKSSLFSSTGLITLALSASWTVPASAGYYVVLVAAASTTLPTLSRGATSSLTVPDQISSQAYAFATNGSGLTDLPATTVAWSGSSANAFWVGVSA